MKTLIVVLSLQVLPVAHHNPGPGHWYPPICCSDHDCYPIPADSVWELGDNRYWLYPIGKAVGPANIHQSEDGQYHVCTSAGEELGPGVRVKCLFVPPRGY